jgi:hypothetical protein
MEDRPNVLCEIGARAHGAFMLGFFAVVWVAATSCGLFVPGLPVWWVDCWIAAATLTVAIIGAQLIPLVIGGGTYRVVVQEEWLRVESPYAVFGPSFAVALAAITDLVVLTGDCPDCYEIHTLGGEKFRLAEGAGETVFQAIRSLRPEIPIERRG